MLEEVHGLLHQQFGQVIGGLHLVVQRGQLGHRHGHDLGVHAAVVFHLQHAHRTAADDDARRQREGGHDQHVDRVAVTGDGVRHIAVVDRVTHRSAHEAIDEDGAAVLVHFELDRITLCGDLDDDVDVVRYILAGADQIETHDSLPWKNCARIIGGNHNVLHGVLCRHYPQRTCYSRRQALRPARQNPRLRPQRASPRPTPAPDRSAP